MCVCVVWWPAARPATPRALFFLFSPNLVWLTCWRSNALLESQGFKGPTVRKTGTTIVGLVFKDGVVLGADTRATGQGEGTAGVSVLIY